MKADRCAFAIVERLAGLIAARTEWRAKEETCGDC